MGKGSLGSGDMEYLTLCLHCKQMIITCGVIVYCICRCFVILHDLLNRKR